MTFDSSKKTNRAWREWAFFIFLMFFEFFCFFSVFPSPLYFCCVVSIFDAFPLIFFALGVGKCSLFLRCLPISSATILIFRSPLYFISSVSCVSFLWFHSIFPCAWHEWVFSIWVSIFHLSEYFPFLPVFLCLLCLFLSEYSQFFLCFADFFGFSYNYSCAWREWVFPISSDLYQHVLFLFYFSSFHSISAYTWRERVLSIFPDLYPFLLHLFYLFWSFSILSASCLIFLIPLEFFLHVASVSTLYFFPFL